MRMVEDMDIREEWPAERRAGKLQQLHGASYRGHGMMHALHGHALQPP